MNWTEHVRISINKLCVVGNGKYMSEDSLREAYFVNFESDLPMIIGHKMYPQFKKRAIGLIKNVPYL